MSENVGKSPGRPFKRGNTASVGHGRPPHSPEYKAFKSLNKEEMARLLTIFLNHSIEEVKAFAKDPKSPAMMAVMASCFMKAHETGNFAFIESVLQRTVGKVKEQIEVFTPKPTIVKMLDGSTMVLGTSKGDKDEGNSGNRE